jgi:hypothetical protein
MNLAQEWSTRTKDLPIESEHRLASTTNLAFSFRSHANYDRAAEIYKEVFKVTKRVYGDEHPSTMLASSNLASAYSCQGNNEAAEAIQRKLFEVEKTKFGMDHPATLATANNLASSLRDQAKLTEASTIQRQVVQTATKVSSTRLLVCLF